MGGRFTRENSKYPTLENVLDPTILFCKRLHTTMKAIIAMFS